LALGNRDLGECGFRFFSSGIKHRPEAVLGIAHHRWCLAQCGKAVGVVAPCTASHQLALRRIVGTPLPYVSREIVSAKRGYSRKVADSNRAIGPKVAEGSKHGIAAQLR